MSASRSLALALGLLACDSPVAPPPEPGVLETSATTAATPSVMPSVASAVAPPTSELDLVRQGDLGAMKRLELTAPGERSIEQALALNEGRAALAGRDAQRLVDDLAKDAKLRLDPRTLAYAARLSLDPAAAPTLLAGLVAIGDPKLLDFVHDLGARGDRGARLTLLVHELLRAKAVRPKASKALSVLLDLEDAELCWQVANQLGRAAADADSRAAPLLERLELEKGCGPKKLDDCFPCLREPANADALQKAIDAVPTRKLEAFWLAK